MTAAAPATDREPTACGALPHAATAARHLGEGGSGSLEARCTGRRRIASLVLLATFEAPLLDVHRRLKVCRDPRCHVAFRDRSRDNSGVPRGVNVCGHAADPRAPRPVGAHRTPETVPTATAVWDHAPPAPRESYAATGVWGGAVGGCTRRA